MLFSMLQRQFHNFSDSRSIGQFHFAGSDEGHQFSPIVYIEKRSWDILHLLTLALLSFADRHEQRAQHLQPQRP